MSHVSIARLNCCRLSLCAVINVFPIRSLQRQILSLKLQGNLKKSLERMVPLKLFDHKASEGLWMIDRLHKRSHIWESNQIIRLLVFLLEKTLGQENPLHHQSRKRIKPLLSPRKSQRCLQRWAQQCLQHNGKRTK